MFRAGIVPQAHYHPTTCLQLPARLWWPLFDSDCFSEVLTPAVWGLELNGVGGVEGGGDIIQGPGKWGQGLLASSAGTTHYVCSDKAGARPADVFMRLGWTPPQQAQHAPWQMIKISLGLWDPLGELNENNWKALRASHRSWKLTDSADLRSSVWICWSWRISAIWKF